MTKKVKEPEIVNLTIPIDSAFTHVLFNLAAQGYSHIIVDYSGGGDEGAVDDVLLIKRGDITESEDRWQIKDDYQSSKPNSELNTLLEEKAHDRILTNLSDWWNNEGGGGRLFISTDNGEYHCEHYTNETVQKDELITGNFSD